jgi:hypothetical protein
MNNNPEDLTSHTIQNQESLPYYVRNKYSAKHGHVLVDKLQRVASDSQVPSATMSGSRQSFYDLFDLFSKDEESFMATNVAGTTPRQHDPAAPVWPTPKHHLNSLPYIPKNWGQDN